MGKAYEMGGVKSDACSGSALGSLHEMEGGCTSIGVASFVGEVRDGPKGSGYCEFM